MALAPPFESLLDTLVTAEWDRRAAASALIFHSATQVSSPPHNSGSVLQVAFFASTYGPCRTR